MSFINWGSDSHDQREARARAEMEVLYEQSVRMRLMAQAQGGVGASKGTQTIDPSENQYVENGYIDNYYV
jgi:hypothetical protein